MIRPAFGQTPTIDDPEANLIEELVVKARLPGPAWWRIADADTVIDIIGIPAALPDKMAWDQAVLERRLNGAFVLITPPEARAGLFDLPAAFSLSAAMRSKTPLDESLPPEMQDRLAKARRALGKPADAYQDWKPLAAGLNLVQDFGKRARLKNQEPGETISRLARRAGVKSRPTGTYPAIPVARQIVKTHSADAGLACLDEAIKAVEAGPAPVEAAAKAWAEGDVRGAMGDSRGEARCYFALPGVADLRRRAIKDEADALQAALNTPGHAVAALSIRSLVAEGGILDQLRARGVTISSPGD